MISRLYRPRAKKVGLSPGSLVHIGDQKAEKVRIRVMDYDETHCEEREPKAIEECFPFKDTPTVTWINIDGLHEVGIIEKIGKEFAIHPLILEDILTTGQRPKLEESDDYIFIVLRMFTAGEDPEELQSEQMSLLLGPNFVISFQEREGDIFDPIRDRIRQGKGRIRKLKADYLAYCLVDAIIDHYFVVLEQIGERVELLEDQVVLDPDPDVLRDIYRLKHELIHLRKSVWPLREVIGALDRVDSPFVAETTRPYLRDIYDHTVQVIDAVETFRDIAAGMLDIYLSSLSNRMNEVMKVLTIIATLFIPLTFIVGVYGMNFEYMPELKWRYGYLGVWGVMVAIAIGMIIYFKKRRWW